MTKDSFREKRCLVFWAFSKVLVFSSQESIFLWLDQLYFILFLSSLVVYFNEKKPQNPGPLDGYEFPRWEPMCCAPVVHSTPCTRGLQQPPSPAALGGHCLMPNPRRWDCTYELDIHVWLGCMDASTELCVWRWAQPGFGPADFSKITEHIKPRAEMASLLSVLSPLCSAIPFLKGSESAHSPTSLFNKNYFLSQLQAAEKMNLNFP